MFIFRICKTTCHVICQLGSLMLTKLCTKPAHNFDEDLGINTVAKARDYS